MSLDLQTMRAALGGYISKGQLRCPGPRHRKHDDSLSIKLSATAPNGFVLNTFSTKDDIATCRDYVCQRLGLPSDKLRGTPGTGVSFSDTSNTRWRTERAVELWHKAQDPRGTIAEKYLHARKLDLPPELCISVLRFHPRCPWEGGLAPCLIAPFRSITSDQITAIHRIRLDQPEAWPKVKRKMFGPVKGSAIKLDAVVDGVVVGEGLETCLAARQLGFRPVWALGGATAIQFFAPIPNVNELVILGERDGGANAIAAYACRKLWSEQLCSLAMPGDGFKDFNDQVMGRRHD
jgi:hypothetical protein